MTDIAEAQVNRLSQEIRRQSKVITRYRAALEQVRECLPDSPMTVSIIDVALDDPESRGERPLLEDV